MAWWGTEKKPDKRLVAETRMMRDKFPEGQWVRVATATGSRWPKPDFWIFVEECRLTMTTEDQLRWRMRFQFQNNDRIWQFRNSPSEYTFTLTYPGGEDYPAYPPEALIKTLLEGSPGHRWEIDGIYSRPCMYDPEEGRSYGWDPSKDTAVVMAGWVIEWLLAYRVQQKTGDWPPGVDAD